MEIGGREIWQREKMQRDVNDTSAQRNLIQCQLLLKTNLTETQLLRAWSVDNHCQTASMLPWSNPLVEFGHGHKNVSGSRKSETNLT